MDEHAYALLVAQLTVIAHAPEAFDQLDTVQIETLSELLQQAHHTTDAAWQARLRAEREDAHDRR